MRGLSVPACLAGGRVQGGRRSVTVHDAKRDADESKTSKCAQ